MDKDSKHPYAGLTVFFGTLHGKERAVRPALRRLGIECQTVAIDTDRFGTFSGEIERRGPILDTLKAKAQAVFEAVPEAHLALASEGSFGPHPALGLIPCDYEALLLVERGSQEFRVDSIFDSPRSGALEITSTSFLETEISRLGFPDHALVVKPKGAVAPIHKGLRTMSEVQAAVLECLSIHPGAIASVENDLRAHMNPTRMRAIEAVAEMLVERISSQCPKCRSIGFWPRQRLKGLPCLACHTPTQLSRGHEWGCGICNWVEFRSHASERVLAEPKDCPTCNP